MDQRALEGAAGGQEPLRNLQIYNTWENFYESEGQGHRIALSGKLIGASNAVPFTEALLRLSGAATEESSHQERLPSLYLFFGPEDLGFSTEDTVLMHHCCELPTFGRMTSLNLAHAVLLALYIVRSQFDSSVARGGRRSGVHADSPTFESSQQLDYPHELIEEWLQALGFNLGGRKVSAAVKLHRMILRAVPSADELKLLRDLIHQNLRKLGRKAPETP